MAEYDAILDLQAATEQPVADLIARRLGRAVDGLLLAQEEPSLEFTRVLQVRGLPIALIIDEVPLLPRLGATQPLLARGASN